MIINKHDIQPKLAKLKLFISGKPKHEELKGILIDNDTMTATDMETMLVTKLDVSFEQRFILPQRAIDMIESLPGDTMDITVEGQTVIIESGRIKNKFNGLNPDSFPELPGLDAAQGFSIDAEKFKESVSQVMYAIATDISRPVFAGLHLHGDGESVNFVASDTHRLAWAKLPYSGEFKVIVPRSAIQLLFKLGLKGDMNMAFDSRMASFALSDYIMYSRLLSGDYPNYRQLFVPRTNSVILPCQPIIESASRAMICSDNIKVPIVVVDIEGEEMKVSSQSDVGEYFEKIALENNITKPVRLGFNAKYLVDCLRAYRSENVECSFDGSTAPMFVDDGELKSVALPVRLRD